MKRSIIAVVAILGLGLASCKKDYQCDCKRIVTEEDGTTTTTNDGSFTFKDSRTRAETKCNDKESSTDGGIFLPNSTRECQIK